MNLRLLFLESAMSLCDLCRGITFDNLTSRGGYHHHSSFSALKSSADGCSLCKLLCYALTHHNLAGESPNEDSLDTSITIGVCTGSYVGLEERDQLTSLDAIGENIGKARLC